MGKDAAADEEKKEENKSELEKKPNSVSLQASGLEEVDQQNGPFDLS